MSHFHFKAESWELTTLQWLLLTQVKVLFGKNMQLLLGTKTDFYDISSLICYTYIWSEGRGGEYQHTIWWIRFRPTTLPARIITLSLAAPFTSALNPSVFWLYLSLLLWQCNPSLWHHVCSLHSLAPLFFSLSSLSLFSGVALLHSHQLALMEKTAVAVSSEIGGWFTRKNSLSSPPYNHTQV